MQYTDVLIKKNLISKDEVLRLTNISNEKRVNLEDLLKEQGISAENIFEAKTEILGVVPKKVDKKPPMDILKLVPEEAARHYKFVPIGIKDGVLEIGMTNPDNIEAREALQFIVSKTNIPFEIFLISESDIESIFEAYKGIGGEVTKVLSELESALVEAEGVIPEEILKSSEGREKIVEEAPITKMMAVILKHAVSGNASDIHIEPQKDKLKVRFRIDGILHTSLILPLSVRDAVASRIKILTNMKLDEKRKPQDGRFSASIEGRQIDFRVSTFPTAFGEKVVMRILDQEKGIKTLEELGLRGRNLEEVRKALKNPYGIILLTGPTGSGKTTTLYAMLQELDREKKNVVSLEDPVEYNIEGISQSQVKPEIGYNFANGLRSILRQDPDIIMVGEIRDKETATLAVQAALTGHLVFSTLHTNNAAGVIPRLIDMGVDPFLIAPTLQIAIAQRLMRTLCADSRSAIPVTGATKEKIETEMREIPPEIKKNIKLPKEIYQGVPSPVCPQGSKGRMGAFEVLVKTPELEKIILTNPIEPEIIQELRKQNMIIMREDALMKVLAGQIGIEELNQL